MNVLWLIIGGLAVAVALLTAWHRRAQGSDLGTVSHHWVAEHRFGRRDSQR